jgi:hypothetical protein
MRITGVEKRAVDGRRLWRQPTGRLGRLALWLPVYGAIWGLIVLVAWLLNVGDASNYAAVGATVMAIGLLQALFPLRGKDREAGNGPR